MPIAQLISPNALDARKEQSGLVILDCRFALEDPDYGQRSYADGHIAGASFADLERDLGGGAACRAVRRRPRRTEDRAGLGEGGYSCADPG